VSETATAATNPYAGMSREQLTEIQATAVGNKTNILNEDAFKAAWAVAPVQNPAAATEHGPPVPPTPAQETAVWQHPDYPDEVIAGMTHTECCEALTRLERLPKGFELMNVDWLQNALMRAARDDKVHRVYEATQCTKTAEKEHSLLDSFTRTTNKGNSVLEHVPISSHLHEKFHTVSFNKKLFVYDPESGIYRENAGDLEQAIRIIIEETCAKCSITRDTRDILAYLMATDPRLEYPFNQVNDLLPLKNGILKLNFETREAELLNHGPEHLFTYRIPVTYDPEIPAKEAKDLLGQWVETEDVPLLIQIAAQAILQAQLRVSYKKSYILQGEPHAGKSTYIDFLTRFFGRVPVSSRSLQSLCTDRFVAADLEGKLLNAYDDLQEIPLENVGAFKALTGACNHNIERKFQQSYSGVITCPHVFSCNHPPKYPDDVKYDAAFWERWEYVRFPYSHKVDDTFTSRSFTDRMYSSFLNLIIESMFTIREKHQLTVNREACDVMERWSMAADPLYQFIREKMTENAKASEINAFDRKKLFEQYRKFCELEHIDPRKRIPTQTKFTRDIQGYKMTPTHTSKRIDGKKHTIDVYQGPYSWIGERNEIEPEISGLLGGG
jgi:hypothetical protein